MARVLITGGPTRAYLDDVRFLSNLSTGETAYEIGKLLIKKGHSVSFVIGPSGFAFEKLKPKKCIRVETNDEMENAVMKVCKSFKPNHAVFSAAVLDFAPDKKWVGKRASRDGKWNIQLVPTPKIIDKVKKHYPSIIRIGFKLEARFVSIREAIKLGERLLETMGVEFLVLNFLSQLKKKRVAFLFSKDRKPVLVCSNQALARVILSWMQSSH